MPYTHWIFDLSLCGVQRSKNKTKHDQRVKNNADSTVCKWTSGSYFSIRKYGKIYVCHTEAEGREGENEWCLECLNRNGLHRFNYLEVCSLESGSTWESLGGVALLGLVWVCWREPVTRGGFGDFRSPSQAQWLLLFLLPVNPDVELLMSTCHASYHDNMGLSWPETISKSQLNSFFYKSYHGHGASSQQWNSD